VAYRLSTTVDVDIDLKYGRNPMSPLTYRLLGDPASWRWEILTSDGKVIASGARKEQAEARADAMRAAMHLQHRQSSEQPHGHFVPGL
jgi:hypothetical protein